MNLILASRYPSDLPPYLPAGINLAWLYEAHRGSVTRLYVVQAGGAAGPVKIGVAVNPEERVRVLQIANPEPLRLVAHIPATVTIEAALHASLTRYRRRGEWFDLAPPVAEVVSEIFEIALMLEDYERDGCTLDLAALTEIMQEAHEQYGIAGTQRDGGVPA